MPEIHYARTLYIGHDCVTRKPFRETKQIAWEKGTLLYKIFTPTNETVQNEVYKTNPKELPMLYQLPGCGMGILGIV